VRGWFSVTLTMLLFSFGAPTYAAAQGWQGEAIEVTQKGNVDPVVTLRRVEEYLNNIQTITSDFNQVAPDGSLAEGKLYIKRPGKMRWQYSPPTPVLMVSNGDTLTYYDYELDQISHVALDDTLAGLLAQPNIDFEADDLRVINFREGANSIRFTLLKTGQLDEGTLTLELSDKPLKIENLVVSDAAGNITSIQLQDAQYNLALDDELFTFENPRSVFKPRYKQ
jgi:outer membrane lipoprotein-sorting protein